jgi:DivIVA domain-containing protein
MDLTAQELRDFEIRESLRGYERDEVNALLGRAAVTIETLEDQLRALLARRVTVRLTPANADTPGQPAPPQSVSDVDATSIGRTLIVAQSAADEAITEAQARVQQLIGESEAKAEALVNDAQSTARRVGETERRRIETEISDLGARRDALTAEADALERFGATYRHQCIRHAIEVDLARLEQSPPAEALRPPRLELPIADGQHARIRTEPLPEHPAESRITTAP